MPRELVQETQQELIVESVVWKIVARVYQYDDGHKEVCFEQYCQKVQDPRKGYDYCGTQAFIVERS